MSGSSHSESEPDSSAGEFSSDEEQDASSKDVVAAFLRLGHTSDGKAIAAVSQEQRALAAKWRAVEAEAAAYNLVKASAAKARGSRSAYVVKEAGSGLPTCTEKRRKRRQKGVRRLSSWPASMP